MQIFPLITRKFDKTTRLFNGIALDIANLLSFEHPSELLFCLSRNNRIISRRNVNFFHKKLNITRFFKKCCKRITFSGKFSRNSAKYSRKYAKVHKIAQIFCVITSVIEKVPRGIQGEKSSKVTAISRILVSTILKE